MEIIFYALGGIVFMSLLMVVVIADPWSM